MKYLLGIVAGVAITLAVVVVLLVNKPSQTQNSSLVAAPTMSPTPKAVVASPIASPLASAVPTGSGVATGIISGKLCYPSQFLPEGAIEAKSTVNNTVVSESYAGTEGGAGNTYELAVPAGTYILRYKAGELYGYHTDVCPTGIEPSCAAANARENIKVEVAAKSTVTGIDLCDFYYSEETNPGF